MRLLNNTVGSISETLFGQDSWRRDMGKRFAVLAVLAILGLFAFLALSAIGSTQAQNTPASTKSFTLNWADPGGGSATGYQYSTDHGVTWADVSFDGGGSFEQTITGPAPGTAIVFLLRAGGTGEQSPRPTPVAGGNAPVLSASSADPFTITLAWTKPTQGPGTPVAVYELDWSPDGAHGSWQFLTRLDQSDSSYNDANLHFETTRYYRIRAADASFNYGPWSQTVRGSTVSSPGAMALSVVETYPGIVRLTWKESTGRSLSNIHRYELEWSPDGTDGSWQRLTNINHPERQESHEDNVPPGTTRYYRIRAVDDSLKESPWSQPVSITATFPAPEAPYVTARAAGSGSVHLEWFELYDVGTPLTKFELQVSGNGGNSYSALESSLPGTALSYIHSGLRKGDERVYRLRACHAGGCGDWGVTPAVTAGANPVPLAPAVTAQARNSSIITLTWTRPDDGGSGITRYEIQASEDPGDWHNPWSQWVWDDSLGYEHENLDPETTMHYRVRALNSNGEGFWSTVQSATTGAAGAPAAPTGLTATVRGNHRIDLSWQAPAGDTGITGYRLERSNLDAGQPWEPAATNIQGTSHSDTGLDAGTNYEYRVAAINSVGTGEFSWGVSGRTTGAAFDAPSLTATAHQGHIALTWTEQAVAPNSCQLERYDLEWSPDGSDWRYLWSQDAGHQRSFEDHVTPGTTYYYRIRAVDYCEASTPWSQAVSAAALFWPPQDPSVNARAVGSDSTHIEWEVFLGEDDTPITRIDVEVSTDGGSSFGPSVTILDGETASFTTVGHPVNATFIYRVRACNKDGCSNWSVAPSVTVNLNSVPKRPVLTAEVRSAAIVALSWTQPDSGDSEITGYELQYSKNDGPWEHQGNFGPEQTSYVIDGLDGGTKVRHRIRANNGNGAGLWSAIAAVTTTIGAPSAPLNLSATAGGDRRIDLTWDAPKVNPSGGIQYRVERIDLFGGDGEWEERWELATTTSERSYSDTGLNPGSQYYYRVVASNGSGMGPYSDWISEMTTGPSPVSPGQPAMLRFSDVKPGEVAIAWQAPEDDGGRPVTGYQYQVESQCSGWETAIHDAVATEARITGLKECDGMYYFKVRAVNAIGAGEWSLHLSGRVPVSGGGRVIVEPTARKIREGETGTFNIRLSKAPTKALTVYFFWEGDEDITNSAWSANGNFSLTPDNWEKGVTLPVELPRDDDAIHGAGVIHINVFTEDNRLASERRDNPLPDEPVYHGQAGVSILVTEVDPD